MTSGDPTGLEPQMLIFSHPRHLIFLLSRLACHEHCHSCIQFQANPHELQQGINATHHLLEGYVKALGSETPECSAFHLCEAGAAATRLGPVGRSFAKVARYLFVCSESESQKQSLDKLIFQPKCGKLAPQDRRIHSPTR